MPDLANPNASPPPSPGEGNLQPGIIVTTLIVTVLVDTVVALRLVTRKWIVKSIGWDDWTIIMAAVSPRAYIIQKLALTVQCSYWKQ